MKEMDRPERKGRWREKEAYVHGKFSLMSCVSHMQCHWWFGASLTKICLKEDVDSDAAKIFLNAAIRWPLVVLFEKTV